jgi:hypothetical protein
LLIANPPSAKVAYIGNEVVQFNHIHYGTARIPVSPEEAELLAELNTAKECTTWPHAKTEAEMREALKDLDQELAKRGQPFGTEVTRQANWERFRRCKDITQETLDEITAKVSQSDNPEMLYDYALAVMKEKPEVARVILEKEWNRTGSILTLGELSQVGTPLAYKMAYMAAMIAMQHDNFKPLLEETMNSTSLSELSEATQQAAQILRSPICCAYP